MSGIILPNDAVSASGLDPGAAPDWRSVAPSSARLSFATPQFSCTRNERDWFLFLAYSAGERPGTVLRRFAEAYADGALVPFIPELGEPKNQRRLIHPAGRFFPSCSKSKRRSEHTGARMPTACRSARSCAASWSTTCGESEPRELLKPRPSSLNRSGAKGDQAD
jgi:hypothetical protein